MPHGSEAVQDRGRGRAARRGDGELIKPSDWDFSRRSENDYYSEIMRVLEKTRTVSLIDLPTLLELWSRQIASRMVLGRLSSTARTWRAAASEAMQGRRVYELLQRELQGPVGARVRQLIEQNALLIRTLPQEAALQASQEIARRAQAGLRPSASEELSVLRHVQRWQARRLARTETAKAQAALTQARAEELNLNWYVWRTSEDERVRPSHRKMDAVLFRFDDPPSPEALAGERSYGRYNAGGGSFNCRCFAEPLLRLNQVEWSHRVYAGGVIRMMTLSAFRQLNSLPREVTRLGVAA